jgi:hypothetical protein
MTRVLRSYRSQDEAATALKKDVTQVQHHALGQALNDAFGTGSKWKNSGEHDIDGYGRKHIHHVSAGIEDTDKTVTLFFFFVDTTFHLIAVGQHKGGDRYRIDSDLGQDEEPFKAGKLVGPTGRGGG